MKNSTKNFLEKLSQIPSGGADMSRDQRQALAREFLVLQQAHQRGHSTAELGQGDIYQSAMTPRGKPMAMVVPPPVLNRVIKVIQSLVFTLALCTSIRGPTGSPKRYVPNARICR